MEYTDTIYKTQRWKTRVVQVGSVAVGGDNPIRIQSMTTSDTRDVRATVAQILQLADWGCEIARVTVQGMKEADACEDIKNALVQKGCHIPLVADIHFYPPAAMRVVDSVDKVRINPGNFVDKRATFKVLTYDDQTYQEEIRRIEEKFSPLVEKCKKLGRAMRIGTNHGSLSDRILNRYGDTPYGMVESALEFARVCRALDYHDIIFSMKASNTRVMIHAYRLLVARMRALGWDYPLHLGVTEAGEGQDGRVKSAIGMGSLLIDGIGDTIRVSLTEDPWYEIDPCKRLIAYAEQSIGQGTQPFSEKHRKMEGGGSSSLRIPSPLHADGSVVLFLSPQEVASSSLATDIGCHIQLGQVVKGPATADLLVVEDPQDPRLASLVAAGVAVCGAQEIPLLTEEAAGWDVLLERSLPYVFFSPRENLVHEGRRFFAWMQENKIEIPVILCGTYSGDEEEITIPASAAFGSLLCDGIGQGVALCASEVSLSRRNGLSFAILQGARMRQSKTEFISCPGCGRTLFDLQSVAARIREKTEHLPGVKIAIMGCIVNGPGEMADADFGYVGSKPGKIDLYLGKQCVQRDIPMAEAEYALVELIKSHGKWVEKDAALLQEC